MEKNIYSGKTGFFAQVPQPFNITALAMCLPQMPQVLNDISEVYWVENKIEEGGFGKVFKAVCKRTHERVAIKQMRAYPDPKSYEPDPAEEEIRVLKTLRHPNIVRYVECYRRCTDNTYFLVLEYMSYDLFYLLDKWELTVREKRYIFKHICQGLAYLHTQNIVHRDMKPENILINKEGDVKITDFGTALDKNTNLGPYNEKCCTRSYAAPEVLLGATSYHRAVDLWSMGVILAKMFGVELFKRECSSCLDQLYEISKICGTVPLRFMQRVHCLERVNWKATAIRPRILYTYIRDLPSCVALLIDQLLQYDDTMRPTVRQCQGSEYLDGPIAPPRLKRRRSHRH